MKNRHLLAVMAAVLSLSVFSSCEKEGVRLFDGSYSFKTSGILTIDRKMKISTSSSESVETAVAGTQDIDIPDIDLPDIDLPDIDLPDIDLPEGDRVFSLPLTSESGQMNIVKTGGNSVIVTMNVVGGDALVFDGEADGKTLTLKPLRRIISFRDGTSTVRLDITAEGTAEKHGNVAVFTLTYTGDGESTLYDYKIKESEVRCVAKENE